MITVGLDFGTHQTKVCVEEKEGAELSYTFMRFPDLEGNMRFALPSIIGRKENDTLCYGFIEDGEYAEVIQYFKQGTFCQSTELQMKQPNAMMYSVLYISNLLFDIEQMYGNDIAIQMGVPADSENLETAGFIAKVMVCAAFMLVEDVFQNNKEDFQAKKMLELWKLFTGVLKSPDYKERLANNYYSILVFPEAYVCLKPLVEQGKLTNGVSLMMDIGGGTTDMSFFNIENDRPQVYRYYSLSKGLNYLTAVDLKSPSKRYQRRLEQNQGISPERLRTYMDTVSSICESFLKDLEKEHIRQTQIPVEVLRDAVKRRPLVYSGGGSTFEQLRLAYGGFKNTMMVDHRYWKSQCVKDFAEIQELGLCPILSIAYGLAIHVVDDYIPQKSLAEIFELVRHWTASAGKRKAADSGFDYGLDYNSLK